MIDLQSLTALLDDEKLVRKYLDRFLQDMPVLLNQMHQAEMLEQWDQLQLHAHTFKSQSQYINATHSIQLAITLEQLSAATLPDRERIADLITQLEQELNETIMEIKQLSV